MKQINALTIIAALLIGAFTSACEVTVTVSDKGDLEITNQVAWSGAAEALTAVHIGTSEADALAQASSGSLEPEAVMTVIDLSDSETYTVLAVDADGLWYKSEGNIIIGGLTTIVTLTSADFNQALTDAMAEPVVVVEEEEESGVGDLTVTNSVEWSGVSTSFVSATVSGPTSQTVDMGIEQGFSMQALPVGSYTVSVTDDFDVVYEVSDVPVERDSESTLDILVSYATSGAINLTNDIDNLDGDEVFVVGLYATPPDGVVVDLAGERNWLEGAPQLGYTESALAIGVAVGNYQLIVADMDDNYYTLLDISVSAGAVSDVSVTADDRDEDLTLALN